MPRIPIARVLPAPVCLAALLAFGLRLHAVNPGPAVLARVAGPPCDAPGHRQFDFWLGHWTVTTPDGRPAGRNVIERVLGGCALREQWTGTSGTTGTSLSAFDPATGRWHQTWVDSDGLLLLLDGRLEHGRMVLRGRTTAPGRATLHCIAWSPLPDGRVRQHWQTSTDDGATWRTEFEGIYVRR